jgi:glycine cleavage system transcriptional repressor
MISSMARFAVMAVGKDAPGHLAAMAGVLVEQGCNVEDTEMAVLQGYSTMMLVVTGREDLTAEVLQAAIEEGTEHVGLLPLVCAMEDGPPDKADEGERWSVSVYGSDRPGIVFEVSRVLAQAGINIHGMKTRVRGPDGLPVYTMALDVRVPCGVDGDEVAGRLNDLARRLDVACSMRATPAGVESVQL